jgi:PIN domain nuclease of toxin-antitoxin system
MSASVTAVLLDTCAVIWLANGDPLHQDAVTRLVQAGLAGEIFVSTASAWEIGMLAKPRPGRGPSVQFAPDPKTWFARFAAGPGISVVDLTPSIAIDASWLPGDLHGDPGDRMIIATARHLRIPIVTRDSKVIAYAGAGHAEVIAC